MNKLVIVVIEIQILDFYFIGVKRNKIYSISAEIRENYLKVHNCTVQYLNTVQKY